MTADSRRAGKGCLYIAVPSAHKADCGAYAERIAEAARRGAAAVIAARGCEIADLGVPLIRVDDVKTASSRIFAARYADDIGKHVKLVAVTGTNGKTSVSHMISHILECAGYRVGTIGTLGASMNGKAYAESPETSSMTTPPPEELYRIMAEMAADGADYIVFEASSQGIAQGRLEGLHVLECPLSAAVFTNLSPEHMDFHPTMEDYFAVKKRLFTEFSPERKIINTTDAYGARLHIEVGGAAVDEKCALDVVMHGVDGVSFTFASQDGAFTVQIPSPGRYAVENGAAAVSCALALGIDADDITRAMRTFYGVRGRMEKVPADLPFSVFIDYAHTPAALEGLLKTMRETEHEKHLVVVFGCGGDRDKTKRPVMGKIATRLSDLAIITSDNRRTERAADIINDIVAGVLRGVEYVVIPDRALAIEFAIMTSHKGDVVVLAGKGHETYDDADGVKTHFDEREVVHAASKLYALADSNRDTQ